MPSATTCSQRFEYRWDEVGRLERARRWDTTTDLGDVDGAVPSGTPAADLRYVYDAGDQRILKEAVDGSSVSSHTVYLFATLELRRASYGASYGVGSTEDYEVSRWTAVPYLMANGVRLARLAYEETTVPSRDPEEMEPEDGGVNASTSQLHVFFELGDHLGSTSVVLDKATGELVERSTFLGYGATESDYRPERWEGFREDYKFTGKEEDVEVGLQYFGKRFLNPYLGRWVSADPLAVHVPGEADWNLYAYVTARVLQAIDPLGLESENVSVDADGLTNIRVSSAPEGVAEGQRFLPNSAGEDTEVAHEDFVKEAKARGGVVFVYAKGGMDIDAANMIAEIRSWNSGGSEGEAGTCTGPACGSAGPNQKGARGETDWSDLAAQVVGLASGEGLGEEGGKKDGSPGGMCVSCEGSDAQQAAVAGVKAAMAAGGAAMPLANRVASIAKRGAKESAGAYLARAWHQGTFPNKTQSIRYHLNKHGKGRTATRYTEDAMSFFDANKGKAKEVLLKDGTKGWKIQTKVKGSDGKTRRIGGYWTGEGKLVTFWD